ncbi:adenylate/guanylate cyclase domain-containing protein [Rhodococcus zopfii]|uniref:adenylate/guanylate cyclase domain-containing protein n=1 Tax=Rhodococcus zopfii TaxID=43772 RepID=UPI00111160F4|nr:adenylate/guanylate cyclase domain-containing protein [Rhodococcus zopfii]
MFTRAGLLDGLTGAARRSRIAVLQQLVDHGVSTTELSRATSAGQLAYLVFDDALAPRGDMYTLEQIAQHTGVRVADVERWFRSMGRGVSTTGSADFSHDDLRLARLLTEYRALGNDDAALFAFARVVGRNASMFADVSRPFLEKQLEAYRERPEVALLFANDLRRFAAVQSRLLSQAVTTRLRQHLSQQVRIGGTDRPSQDVYDVAVCFADLVGFTILGEQLSPTELGGLADRLDSLTTDLVEEPVRFVKTIGDAVMLISPDPTALVQVAVQLVDAARQRGLPPLHVGIAWGAVVHSAGDWVGQSLNRASRIVAVAEPLEILVDSETMSRLDASVVETDFAGSYPLKGFSGEQELYRVRSATNEHG